MFSIFMLFVKPICRQFPKVFWWKTRVGFLVLLVTSLYSYYEDHSKQGETLEKKYKRISSLISFGAFALMSTSLSRQIQPGFEMGMSNFFLGCLLVGLFKMNFNIAMGLTILYYVGFIFHSYWDSQLQLHILRAILCCVGFIFRSDSQLQLHSDTLHLTLEMSTLESGIDTTNNLNQETSAIRSSFSIHPSRSTITHRSVSHDAFKMVLASMPETLDRVIPVVDIYDFEPWLLPGEACRGDREQWFSYVPRQESQARGGRPNRTTASGYWKATGSPGYVYSSDNTLIALKETRAFYRGKASAGVQTKWKMHEYNAIQLSTSHQSTTAIPTLRHEYSPCQVYVILGIFRAFDRRPLDARLHGDFASASGGASAAHQEGAAPKRSSSSETSHSGGDQDVREAGR